MAPVTSPVVLLAFALLCMPATITAYYSGFTGDHCRNHVECRTPRICKGYNASDVRACGSSVSCTCEPQKTKNCTSNENCPQNERCIKSASGSNSTECFSCFSFSLYNSSYQADLLVDSSQSNCPSLLPTPTPHGYRDDPCSDSVHCHSPSQCVMKLGLSTEIFPCDPSIDSSGCNCYRLDLKHCDKSSECQLGERCVSYYNSRLQKVKGKCVSCHAAKYNRDEYGLVDPAIENCPLAVTPAPSPSKHAIPLHCPKNDGLFLDHCCHEPQLNIQPKCTYPFLCLSKNRTKTCQPHEIACQCVLLARPPPCNSTSECNDNEQCIKFRKQSFCISCNQFHLHGGHEAIDNTTLCDLARNSTTVTSPVSSFAPALSAQPQVSSNPSAVSAPPPCIDAQLLSHLPSSHLVFRKHIPAMVFCDSWGSCATPGHVVMFHGKAMMMRRYCSMDSVTCLEEKRLVNSPRMQRAMRVQSPTGSLEFTAFAAKWESVAEEQVLKTLVRLGF